VQSGPWHDALRKLAVDFPKHVAAVRGLGYLVGVQLTSDPTPFIAALRDRGLLVPSAGNNVIRLLPPLNVTAEELAKSVEIFRGVLAAKS
jgi:acetylornithine aminotransferase/acetylornithine/N-succinyldiaminopimelate aminotransferase